MFYGPFISAVFSLIYIPTHSITLSLNFLAYSSVLTSSISSFFLGRYLLRDNRYALLVSLFYISSPNYLQILFKHFVLSAGGSGFAYCFYPLFFLGLFKLLNKHYQHIINPIVLISVSSTLILISHTLSFMLLSIVGSVFLIVSVNKFTKQVFWGLLCCLLSFIGLSAFFVFPFLDASSLEMYYYFLTPSFWWDSLFENRVDWFSIYPTKHILERIFFAPVFLYLIYRISQWLLIKVRNKNNLKKERLCNNWTFPFSVCFIFCCVVAFQNFPFERLPELFLRIQFPSRFILVSWVFYAPLITYVIKKIVERYQKRIKNITSKKYIFFTCICLVLIIFSVSFSVYINHNTTHVNITNQMAEDIKSGANSAEYKPQSCPTLESVSDLVTNYQQIDSKFSFSASGKTNYVIPIWFWKGYVANDSDGNKLRVSPYQKCYVQISSASPLVGEVNLKFESSVATKVGLAISLATTAFCC